MSCYFNSATLNSLRYLSLSIISFHLQNLFSAVRGRGGFNDNPTTQQAGAAMRALSANSLLRQQLANCANVEGDNAPLLPPQSQATIASKSQEDLLGDVIFSDSSKEDEVEVESAEVAQMALSDFTERDTLQYVVGSLFNRLNCAHCCENLTVEVDKETATGITAARLFPGAHLLEARDALVEDLGSRIPKLLNFLKGKLNVHNISKTMCCKFPLPNHNFCTPKHADDFYLLFVRLIIRSFCRDFNAHNRSQRIK